ncbi:hypothetical protein DXG01_000644 [Tephrocybe rancida]|nr:hypothetical protein DXG01_000644 [Tephrocybe rancida]
MLAVPTELVDYIIDFLYDCNPALQACSLVSRTWVQSSRLHLFRNLDLDDTDTSKAAQNSLRILRLRDLLRASPLLAQYIKDLNIRHGADEATGVGILGNPNLPFIFTALSSLVSLKISPLERSVFVGHIPPSLNSSMESMSSLKVLHLNDLNFLRPQDVLRLLRSSSLVTNLTLLRLTFEQPDDISRGVEGPPMNQLASIARLATDSAIMASSFTNSLSPIDISRVEFLEICPSTATYAALTQLLSHAPVLQRLDMTLDADPDHSPPIDLQELLSLNTLVFRIRALLGRENSLPWLHRVMSSLSPDNRVEDLSLIAIVDMPPPNVTQFQYAEFLSTWKQFDLLFTEAKFAPLRRVRIDFRIDNIVGDVVVKAIVDDIIEQLLELNLRGVLHVDSYEMGFG